MPPPVPMESPPLPSGITIGKAEPRDAGYIARLCRHLGYPSSSEGVTRRLTGMAANPEHPVFVPELAQGIVAGLAGIFVMRPIEADARDELTAKVAEET